MIRRILASLVYMLFNVPPGMMIVHSVILVAGYLNLSKAPLRQMHFIRSQEASKFNVAKTETSHQGLDIVMLVYYFYSPIVAWSTTALRTVARDFILALCDRRLERMTVEVLFGHNMDEPDDIAVLDILDRIAFLYISLIVRMLNTPQIICVLEAICSHLLLL